MLKKLKEKLDQFKTRVEENKGNITKKDYKVFIGYIDAQKEVIADYSEKIEEMMIDELWMGILLNLPKDKPTALSPADFEKVKKINQEAIESLCKLKRNASQEDIEEALLPIIQQMLSEIEFMEAILRYTVLKELPKLSSEATSIVHALNENPEGVTDSEFLSKLRVLEKEFKQSSIEAEGRLTESASLPVSSDKPSLVSEKLTESVIRPSTVVTTRLT
jgi:hypothetical protein